MARIVIRARIFGLNLVGQQPHRHRDPMWCPNGLPEAAGPGPGFIEIQQSATVRDRRGNQPVNTFHGHGREPRAGHGFSQKDIEASLALLGLPRTLSLSVLAVELVPGPLTVRETPGREPRTPTEQERNEDPLSTNLGLRRIMRTSPLAAVPAIC